MVKQFSFKKFGADLFKALNTGISYFLPVIIGGGFLFAIAIGTGTVTDHGIVASNEFFRIVLTIGTSGFAMMVPVLCGYIAYAIAGKPALAPGLILGFVVNNPIGDAKYQTGFIGAMIVGIIVGYFTKWMKTWKLPAPVMTVMPLMIMPTVTALVIGSFYAYVLAYPLVQLTELLKAILNGMNAYGAGALGIAIGIMAAIDMGGPASKAATGFTLALMDVGSFAPNGAFRLCCAVPPLGLALATFIAARLFSEEERKMGISAFFLSMAGITEGAIPFAVKDFKHVMPSICIGTAVAGALGMMHNITNIVAFGGLAALPAVTDGKLWYVVDMFIGAFIVAGLMIFFRIREQTKQNQEGEKS